MQKSQYGSDLWYYNFGISINALSDSTVTTISKCCIMERINNTINSRPVTSDVLQIAVSRWEDRYSDIDKLRIAAIENKLPKMTTKQARAYLCTIK